MPPPRRRPPPAPDPPPGGKGGGVSPPVARRVALVIETSNAYSRGLIRGVMGYARRHGGWSLWLAESERGHAPPALRWWEGDGLIARVENRRVAAAVSAPGRPVVDVSAARLLPDAPWVETDDAAIAAAAFDHLRGRGLIHFAYAGDDHFNWSRWRQGHFIRAARDAGYDCRACPPVDALNFDRRLATTARWLAGLPKPVGVLACYDLRAREVLDGCRSAGLRVPDDVAVMGVDNDELLCDLAEPPLTSVAPNAAEAGAEAAALLDRLMNGEEVPPEGRLIPPMQVVGRQSTDILAIDDPDVAAAVRYIRANACRGIGVIDVLRVVPVSRRVLEARFAARLGHTPHEEIARVRTERVKWMLAHTDLAMSTIARQVGYAHSEYLSVAFKKATGETPGTYRKRMKR